jgi:hypothetical protein
MQQLADDLDVSIRTVRRVFGAEIKTARVRLILLLGLDDRRSGGDATGKPLGGYHDGRTHIRERE